MKITNIKISNYRQYRDFEYNFKGQDEVGIYSFLGKNGMGKTNLLNSITWCLYEKENHLGDKNSALAIPNLSAFKELSIRDKIEVSIEIKINDEQYGSDYIFKRTAKFVSSNEKIPFKTESKFQVFWKAPNEKKYEIYEGDMAQSILKKCFPENISEYFFFDGEQLDKYFNHQNAERIKSTILEINELNHLDIMAGRLESLKKNNNKSIGNINIQKINEEIEDLEKNLKQSEEKAIGIEISIEDAKQELTLISDSLKGIVDVAEIEKKREILKNKLNSFEEKEKQVAKKSRQFIINYGTLIYFFPKIRELMSIIKEKEQKNSLPPKIDKNLLKQIQKTAECPVCYTHLSQEGVLKIKEILEQIEVSSSISHKLVLYKPILELFIRQLKEFKSEFKKLNDEKSEIRKDKREINNEINSLEQKLSNLDEVGTIKDKQKRRNILEEAKDNSIGKLSILRRDIEDLKKSILKKKKEFDELLSKEKEYINIQNTNKFIEKAIQILKISRAELLDDIRQEIENTTQILFFDLMWKKNTFEKIEVTKDFNVKLYHVEGYECLGSCSAAERGALALSFTLALHKIANLKTPLVIDTPLSRVSDENRVNFAKTIEKLSEEKQFILLFTPAEYSDDIKEVLDPINSAKIELKTSGESETYGEEI